MKTDWATDDGQRFRRDEPADAAADAQSLFGSIRHVVETTLAVLHSRLELFIYELRDAKVRLFAVIAWTAALFFLGTMALFAAVGIVVFIFWAHALALLVGFSIFFLLAAVGSFLVARSRLNQVPFTETVAQLEKDRELAAGHELEDWRRERDSNPR